MIDPIEKKFNARLLRQEFESGKQSGLLHDDKDPLCRDNIRKANLPHGSPWTEAYWKGYMEGVAERKPFNPVSFAC